MKRAIIARPLSGPGWGVDCFIREGHHIQWNWSGWTRHDTLWSAVKHALSWRFK